MSTQFRQDVAVARSVMAGTDRAGADWGGARRIDEAPPRQPRRRGLGIDLLRRFDEKHAGEGREKPVADPLPGSRRAQHYAPRERWHEQSGIGAYRGELLLAQQARQLRYRIRAAGTERRVV